MIGSRGGRTPHRALLVLLLLVVGEGSITTGSAVAGPVEVGDWSEPFDLGVIGIHATLLHTGQVLLFDYPGDEGTRAKVWDPVSGEVVDVTRGGGAKHDLFCAGQIQLPDGDVLVVGGTRWHARALDGTDKVSIFDPASSRWRSTEPMRYARWYPTPTETPGGRILIFSGWDLEGEPPIRQIERFDPATERVRSLAERANQRMELYPRMHLLPSGNLFWAGEPARTKLFDLSSKTWSFVSSMEHGDRYAGASVLLPGLRRVLAIGGGNPVTATTELIDVSDGSPRWRFAEPMHEARKHANAVLLPDGTVLVVGGGQRGEYRDPVFGAELYDPGTDTWTRLAAQRGPRTYHSTALLLPDGRVLSAGSDSGSPLQETGEIFSPPYLFRGPRPAIASAPSRLGYGETFSIGTPDAADVARISLMKAGSTTHGVDFAQRSVEVAFTAIDDDSLVGTGPVSGAEAPPGWYMLFLVNEAGVPSIASWVRIG